MTTWTGGGVGAGFGGPGALLRTWFEVVVHPHRFFRESVVPGDQAPGLSFAVIVVVLAEASRLGLDPEAVPAVVGHRLLSALLVVAVAALLVAPVALHLVAALATLGLALVAPQRGGISETVQVVAYATAPCVLAGPPVPALRVVATGYGAYLLLVGLREVHAVGTGRAAVAGVLPVAAVFGYGFRGFDAVAGLLSRWYII